MARARSWWRLFLVAVITTIFFASWSLGRLLSFPWPRARARWRRLTFGIWARAVLRAMNVKVEVVGPAPRPPFLLVSNHLSYFDIVVLGSQVDTVFVSKMEVARWPVIGFLVRHLDTIFIDRKMRRDIPRAVARIEEALARGEGIVMFPEGTSTAGAFVGPFQPSLLEPAARGELAVLTAALSYSTPANQAPAHLSVCWWGDMTFVGHFLNMLALPGFSARVAFGGERVIETDRKLLAERLEGEVRQLFVPVVGGGS